MSRGTRGRCSLCNTMCSTLIPFSSSQCEVGLGSAMLEVSLLSHCGLRPISDLHFYHWHMAGQSITIYFHPVQILEIGYQCRTVSQRAMRASFHLHAVSGCSTSLSAPEKFPVRTSMETHGLPRALAPLMSESGLLPTAKIAFSLLELQNPRFCACDRRTPSASL